MTVLVMIFIMVGVQLFLGITAVIRRRNYSALFPALLPLLILLPFLIFTYIASLFTSGTFSAAVNRYFSFYIFGVCIAVNIFAAVRRRNYGDLAFLLLTLPFLVLMLSSLILGGTASGSTADLQNGRYYLRDQGSLTEVSRGVFLYMRVMQIIGPVTFVIAVFSVFIRKLVSRIRGRDA